ncbi:MAG: helix-turn-helix domain-containing protein [Spirochaetales bacterium]|nr:helix-turn-helix domain-containing protein [Spirochaetales bacterium]
MRPFNRIFLSFISAYIVLIMVPLITGMALNSSISSEYEQYVKASQLTHLKKTQDVLENFIDDIKWSTYQIAGNTKLLRLIADKDQKLSGIERSVLIRETMIELNDSLLYNTSFNSTYYIYLKDQDMIITPYSIYTHSDFNDSVNFFKMENISSRDWHTAISGQFYNGRILPVRSVIIEDFKNKRMIPYVQTVPIDRTGGMKNIQGAIVYLIGEADFIRFLETDELPPGGVSYIADDDNNLITLVSRGGGDFIPPVLEGAEGMIERTIDGKKMFIIYTTSRKNDWKYVSVLPEKWVVKSVSFFRLVSIILMLLALFFCLSAAYVISNRWSRPLVSSYRSISGYLNKEGREMISLRSLTSNVSELIHQSEDLQDELISREVFVHNAFVNRLINGFFRDRKDLEKYLDHLGFRISEKYYSVAIITQGEMESAGTAQSFEEIVRVKNFLKTRLQQDFPVRIMIAEQENSDLVLILLTDSDNREEHDRTARESLGDFARTLPHLYSDSLFIALGETVDSLQKVHHSFMQARDVLSLSADDSGIRIVHFSDVDEKIDDFYYPLELESRLITAVKAGNEDVLISLIDTLVFENMKKRVLERSKMNNFLYGLLNSCFRIENQLSDSLGEHVENLPDRYADNPDFESLKSFLLEVCRHQNRSKKSHNVTLVDKVTDYLEKNYGNRNLSLQVVADHFSVNESYLSFFFKEQTGTNFSTYLERIRISKAGFLLKETDEPIHIIAGKVGYNSDKTFRRVFQKHHNLSPGVFREA